MFTSHYCRSPNNSKLFIVKEKSEAVGGSMNHISSFGESSSDTVQVCLL